MASEVGGTGQQRAQTEAELAKNIMLAAREIPREIERTIEEVPGEAERLGGEVVLETERGVLSRVKGFREGFKRTTGKEVLEHVLRTGRQIGGEMVQVALKPGTKTGRASEFFDFTHTKGAFITQQVANLGPRRRINVISAGGSFWSLPKNKGGVIAGIRGKTLNIMKLRSGKSLNLFSTGRGKPMNLTSTGRGKPMNLAKVNAGLPNVISINNSKHESNFAGKLLRLKK